MKLKARFDAVLIEPEEKGEKQYGNIIVPDMGKEKVQRGTVVSVGPGREVAGIGFVKTLTEIGTQVIIPSVGFGVLEHEGKEYYILKENEILADIILEESDLTKDKK